MYCIENTKGSAELDLGHSFYRMMMNDMIVAWTMKIRENLGLININVGGTLLEIIGIYENLI